MADTREVVHLITPGGKVTLQRIEAAGPPTEGQHTGRRISLDLYGALWFCSAVGDPGTWEQLTVGVAATKPTAPPDGYLVIDSADGLLYQYDANTAAYLCPSATTVEAHGDTHVDGTDAVPDFVPDADGDPGTAGLVPAPGIGDDAAGKILVVGGWTAPLTAVPEMTGAAADADGAVGLVPAPLTGEESKYFRGDGTWVTGDPLEPHGDTHVDGTDDTPDFVADNGVDAAGVHGLVPASAIGDDTLQRGAGQRINPESFTHGTSRQRMAALKLGLESQDDGACDVFFEGA
jgi:hypothetical protein